MAVKASSAQEMAPRLAILDAAGTIIAVNTAWAQYAIANDTPPDVNAVGENYLLVCDVVGGDEQPAAAAAVQGIRDVIAGREREYQQDYSCHTPTEEQWFRMRVSALMGINGLQVSIIHEKITATQAGVETCPQPMTDDSTEAMSLTSTEASAWKTAKQDLDQAQSRFNAVLDSIGQSIIIIDRQRRIQVHNEYANTNALAVFGRPLQNGDPIDHYVLPRDQEGFNKHFAAALAGEHITTALKFENADANPRWFEFTYAPVYEDIDEVTGVCFGTIDVTEKHLAENALRNSEELFRAVVQDSLDGITVTDTEGKLILWNPAAERITGIQAIDALGRYTWDIQYALAKQVAQDPDLYVNLRTEIQTALKTGEAPWLGKIVGHDFLDVAEERRHLESLVFAIGTPEGIQLSSIVRDVTEQRRSAEQREALLGSLNQRIRELDCLYSIAQVMERPEPVLEAVLNEVAAIVPTGWTIPENACAQIALDGRTYESPNFVMTSWCITRTIWVGGEARGELHVCYRSKRTILEEERTLAEEIVRRLKLYLQNYQSRLVLETERAELEEHVIQRTAQLAAANEDLKRSTDELQLANLALEKAVKLKDEFLASMSHELRTPLTGILGMAEAMQLTHYGFLTEKQLRAVHLIETSGHHLLDLINDILDVAKIESGHIQLELQVCDARDLCQASLHLINGMANRKNQAVEFIFPADSFTVFADPRRFKQILVNLLSNAVKFTPEGGELGLEVGADCARNTATFTVWDRGIGIAEEDLAKLFEPFIQIDSSLSRHYTGTGLGLTLVRHMTEMHGGAIHVESTPDQGSRFTVELPWSPTTANEATQISSSLHAPAEMPSTSLHKLNPWLTWLIPGGDAGQIEVTTAEAAVDQAAATQPAAILVDATSTSFDGETVIQRLRADKETRTIPLLVAGAGIDTPPTGSEGPILALSNPCTARALLQALAKVAGRSVSSASLMVVGSFPLSPLILLTEDSEMSGSLIREYLESHQCRVLWAHDGQGALTLAEEAHPDLILMDIQMPKVDGLTAIRLIRAQPDEALAHTPIIALTALVMPGDRERCLVAGADDYASKPIKLTALLDTLRKTLRARPPINLS